jgi:glycosyltransferase domain-containing protein
VVDFSDVNADAPAPDLWQRPHSRLSDLTIIVPILPGRSAFLKTLLRHLSESRIGCPIMMTVNSDEPRVEEIEAAVAAYPGLQIRVLYHPMEVHFVDRLNHCARQATTEYVFVHSDDDFVVAGALADCVEFLNANRDHVACQGRSFFFKIHDGTNFAPAPQRFMSREEAGPIDRVLAHCRQYTNTFHAVTRREAFVIANERTMAHTRQVIFWQYLASCWLLALGKLKVLDRLYYLRLDNPSGERAQLVRRADRSHWPYLVVAPDFSSEQDKFKAGLMAALSGQSANDALSDIVDECCLGLIRRAFGAPLTFDKSEVAMHARFFDAGTFEAAMARYCGPRAGSCPQAQYGATP